MAIDTNAIVEALLSRIRDNVPEIGSYARKRKEWGFEELPALEIYERGETAIDSDDFNPPAWRVSAEVVIIAKADDTSNAPFAPVNDLVKKVREALETKDTDRDIDGCAFPGVGHTQHYTTLGGLLRSLTIVDVEKGLGDKSGEPTAKLSIEMETMAL